MKYGEAFSPFYLKNRGRRFWFQPHGLAGCAPSHNLYRRICTSQRCSPIIFIRRLEIFEERGTKFHHSYIECSPCEGKGFLVFFLTGYELRDPDGPDLL